jgi:alkylation response protein AidB-like acyl-CoA dehydrogenase
MHSEPTAEQQALVEVIQSFLRDEAKPVIGEYYERAEFPYPLVQRLGEIGVFGLTVPEEYGGAGGDLVSLCLVLEELARVDSSLAITVEAAVSLGSGPLVRFGSAEQKQRWLPELAAGRGLAAFGLTEPEAGSDASAIRTRARLDADTWEITGSKAFITNSGTDLTRFVTVMAVTGSAADGSPELSTILVPIGTPGLEIGTSYSKVGWSASDTHPVYLDGVRVPAENLVGERGRGYAQFLEILDEGRIAIAALATGLAQGCVDESVSYARQRQAFGSSISKYQAVSFAVADMAARAHTSRLAWREAAARHAAGRDFKAAAAVAKLHSSDAAMLNARAATQVHGGYGFTNESLVGRFYRDAKILEIGEGTNEVQRLLIARELGL